MRRGAKASPALALGRTGAALPDSAVQGPLYREVTRRLLECLARGDWAPGTALPSERELAQRFGVAVSTIRAGVAQLTGNGVLVRRQGLGTFVRRHDLATQQLRFSNIYDSSGAKLTTVRRVVGLKRIRAEGASLERLRMERARRAFVYQVDAALSAGGKPVAAMTLMLPAHLFPKAKREDFEQTDENLYTLYQRKWGITVLRMQEWVSARNADAETALLLGVKAGHPVMRVERVAYTFNDVPVEVRDRVYEGLGHRYLFRHDKLE